MKRILITGANGTIGTALLRLLSAFPERYRAETVSLRKFAPDALDLRGYDAVVHAAAIVHQKETAENRPLYGAVNRDLTAALAAKAKAEGVRQFVFLSTMSVYGLETGVVSKDTAPNPVTAYGRSKLEAERLIAPLADDTFFVTILRPPTVFGPGAKGNYRRLVTLAKKLPVRPDFENRRSMVSIDTLCDAIRACLDAPESAILFPQEPEPVCTADLIGSIAAEQGRTLRATRILNPAIRLFRACTHSGKKAFGDLVYRDLDRLPLSAVFTEEERT